MKLAIDNLNKLMLSMGVRLGITIMAEMNRRGLGDKLESLPHDVVRTIVGAAWEGEDGWDESLPGVVAQMLEGL